jgi:hypothetical protein
MVCRAAAPDKKTPAAKPWTGLATGVVPSV